MVCTFLCAVNKTLTPACSPGSERLPLLLWKNPGSILLCAVFNLSFSYRVQLQLLPITFYLVQLLQVRPPQFNLSRFLCACVCVSSPRLRAVRPYRSHKFISLALFSAVLLVLVKSLTINLYCFIIYSAEPA